MNLTYTVDNGGPKNRRKTNFLTFPDIENVIKSDIEQGRNYNDLINYINEVAFYDLETRVRPVLTAQTRNKIRKIYKKIRQNA